MTARRVFFYVQHLLGIGHLARASRIAARLQADGMEVTLVTGGRPVTGFPPAQIAHVVLPAIAVPDGGFKGLLDADGNPASETYLDHRRDLLLAAYRDARPDIVMIEAFPFGRRQVRFELLPLIEAIEASQLRPKLVTSLRDILQRSGKPGRDEETVAMVNAHFDRVLVHGDPAFAALGDSFALADRIADKIAYTGLVCGDRAEPSPERHDVLVSAGGGAVGAGLFRAALGAVAMLPPDLRWGIIAGPNLPQDEYQHLTASAPANVQIMRFRTDFPALLSASRISVSQAGYNTVGDILQAGCRAILIPFAVDGETEQSDRAEKLSRVGRAAILTEAALSPASLAEAVKAAIAQMPSPNMPVIDIEGAARTSQILQQM
ncbi:MAG: glycosyl transferase [Cereibacter sphaeroides]|uniref:Glycosyl transferase n=1 Tax=Cereibacter sphaeroides TaxID=1063 RepID=A0A2W5S3G0_CERSP|nr:MAG: glycosyl transferase [Cereibacter sphaeroides]